MLLAHRNELGNEQSLYCHLINVGDGCYKLGKELDLNHMSLIVGLLHDIGKSDPLFQDMIINGKKNKVNHSSAGAKYLFIKFKDISSQNLGNINYLLQSYFEILIYVIEAHHGVFDIYDLAYEFPNSLYRRTIYDLENDNYNFSMVCEFTKSIENYCIDKYQQTIDDMILSGFEEYKSILDKLGVSNRSDENVEFHFYNHCLIRLILSILKNEDIFDTVNAYEKIIEKQTKSERNKIIEFYYNQLEEEYKSYPEPKSEINKVRKEISKQIRNRYEQDSNGVYKLDLPTGAGKTKLSLLYSLHQMKSKGKERMFYIAPFLSILEQNANEIRKTLLNEGFILEHHTNVIDNSEIDEYRDNDIDFAMKEYVNETWDQIIVLSSMVQFTNTLFKSKSSNLRRFYNLSNSVIILDEVQSLPTKVTHIFNLMINFISKVMKSTIVLCSATQPILNHNEIKYKINYGGAQGEAHDLVGLSQEQIEIFKRTKVRVINEGSKSCIQDIYQQISNSEPKSTLIILNTKKAVENLYHLFAKNTEIPEDLYYITTNMCPKHRLDVIEEIRLKLKNGRKVLVVSTSLIEAGVDLDFEVLYRSYAGIDSIVQAMGRCNREGKKPVGEVFLINIRDDEENLKNLPSIHQRKKITEEILSGYKKEFNIKELNNLYYSKLFSNQNDLDYKLQDGNSILSLLSTNKQYRGFSDIKGINLQSFKEASDRFNLIEDDSDSVIVYYEESYRLIEDLITAINEFDSFKGDKDKIVVIKSLLRRLQPYTINIYSTKDIEDNFIKVDGLNYFNIRILNESNYDSNVGLTEESNLESFIV